MFPFLSLLWLTYSYFIIFYILLAVILQVERNFLGGDKVSSDFVGEVF